MRDGVSRAFLPPWNGRSIATACVSWTRPAHPLRGGTLDAPHT
jgi:hypothetical protein